MVAGGAKSRPRKVCGGRSARYESRRARERGGAGRNAAEWSDAVAPVVLDAIHEGSASEKMSLKDYIIWLLLTPWSLTSFTSRLKTGQSGRALAATILAKHAARMATAGSLHEQRCRARAVLKPLRDRRSSVTRLKALELPRATGPLGTFQKCRIDYT